MRLFFHLAIWTATLSLLRAGPANEAQLVGKWNSVTNFGVTEIEFSHDHTYKASFQGMANGSESGTWRLQGERLTRKATGGDLKDLLGKSVIGREWSEIVEEVDARALTTRSEGGLAGYHHYRRGAYDPDRNPGSLKSSAEVMKASADSDQLTLSALPPADFPAVAKFRELREARFFDAAENDARLAALAQVALPALESIDLADCPRVTDAGIIPLATHGSMHGLHLRGTSIGDAGCKALAANRGLTWVNVDQCLKISSEGMLALAHSASLKTVNFSTEILTSAEVLKLIAAFPPASELGIHDPRHKLDAAAVEKAARSRGVKAVVNR